MPQRRFPQSVRTTRTQSVESASAAAERILRVKPSLHRIASYGEVREHYTHRRWWVRRGMLSLMIFLAAGPLNHGLYTSLVKHRALTASPVVEQALAFAALPLCLTQGAADDACEALVQITLGKRSLTTLVSGWLLYGLPLLLVSMYALSPGPVWWGFRLLAIELMAAVYALMELLYAPLIWLVDRSKTAREFYEGYYDAMEWID